MKRNVNKQFPAIPDTQPPKTRRRTSLFTALSFLVTLSGGLPHQAYAVPMMTNYQGYLEDVQGQPLEATVKMTFALYDKPAGGTPLWTETHNAVTVTGGVFSVVLGSVVKFDAKAIQGERYLGVALGNDTEMKPRQALVSTAFAIRAGVAESVAENGVTTGLIANGAVTKDKVADNAVTTVKIADGAVTGAKIADLSGHSATELDGITSVGSGAIITEEERQKLHSSIGKKDPSVTNLTVEKQLDVKKRIKVGDNSLWLGSDEMTGSSNTIWTTPPSSGKHQLAIQSYGHDGDTVINASSAGKVGIGTNNPQAKLDVLGNIAINGSPIIDSNGKWVGDPTGLKGDKGDRGPQGPISVLKICYQAHVRDIGWMAPVCGGNVAGTTGQFRRMEAVKIWIKNAPSCSVEYQAHVAHLGWMKKVSDGQTAGTTGQSRRMEALKIWLNCN